jgi:hypothetical protein
MTASFSIHASSLLAVQSTVLSVIEALIDWKSNKINREIDGNYSQGRPLGGASGALAPGADFEGAPKRQSPTGHTLISSTVAW